MRTRAIGIRSAWSKGGPVDRLLIALATVVALALLGAFVFGAWHVLFGGFVRGNWRAGGFGVALAAVTGTLLAVGAALVARHR